MKTQTKLRRVNPRNGIPSLQITSHYIHLQSHQPHRPPFTNRYHTRKTNYNRPTISLFTGKLPSAVLSKNHIPLKTHNQYFTATGFLWILHPIAAQMTTAATYSSYNVQDATKKSEDLLTS